MNEWLNWIELNWIGLNWIELNDWVNEWVKQWKNAWMNEWMNDWMDGWMNECMNECVKWNETKWNQMKWTETKWLTWMKERMSEWMSEAMNAWMNHWSNECMNEWMKRKEWNEWTQWNEWNESNAWNAWLQGMKWLNDTELMSAWLHECLKEERKGKRNEWKVDFVLIFFVRARRIAFARAGWRVVSWADSWWSNDSKGLHSSTQILIIFFLQPLRACGTWYGNANGIQASDSPVDATNVGTTSEWFFIQGHPLVLRCFFSVWFGPCSSTRMAYDGIVLGKPSPRYSPVDVSSTTFADRGPKPRKQRPYYFGNCGSHFTRKNAGFRARQSFQAWTHTFPTCYISQLWHVDVVDMMMWLTWWWECMRIENAGHDNRPYLGSLLTKLPLIIHQDLPP